MLTNVPRVGPGRSRLKRERLHVSTALAARSTRMGLMVLGAPLTNMTDMMIVLAAQRANHLTKPTRSVKPVSPALNRAMTGECMGVAYAMCTRCVRVIRTKRL